MFSNSDEAPEQIIVGINQNQYNERIEDCSYSKENSFPTNKGEAFYRFVRSELFDYFDHTSCSDDVAEAKPDPALYHLGLEKMGSAIDKVLVLEDSPNGVLAAKRAGLYCIAVPNKITSQLPFFENGGTPDRVLDSLREFPWDEYMKVN